MNKENSKNTQNLLNPSSLRIQSKAQKSTNPLKPSNTTEPNLFVSPIEGAQEEFHFSKAPKTEPFRNNLDLLSKLDSKRVLFYNDDSQLGILNERFTSIGFDEEEVGKMNFEEFRSMVQFSQAAVELYNYLQAGQNKQIMEAHLQHKSLSSVKNELKNKEIALSDKLDQFKNKLTKLKTGISEVHEKSKTIGVFKCPICENKAFKSKEFLEKHVERRHKEIEKEDEKKLESWDQRVQNTQSFKPEARAPVEIPPINFDEDKLIGKIGEKIVSEVDRISFNLQLEFSEKFRQFEDQSKMTFESLIQKQPIFPTIPIESSNGENPTMNEVLRLNESILRTQIQQERNMEKSKLETEQTFKDYGKKMKKLSKSLRKITLENASFQRSFFKNLRELRQEHSASPPPPVESQWENDQIIENSKESMSPKKMSPIESPVKQKRIPLSNHIGDLLSDADSEEYRDYDDRIHSVQDETPTKGLKPDNFEPPPFETPVIKEVSPNKALKIIEEDHMDRERMEKEELLHEKEKEFIFLLNSKKTRAKQKLQWDNSKGMAYLGSQEFDLSILDSFIEKKLEETQKIGFNEVEKMKTKELMGVWEACLKENLEVVHNIQDFKEAEDSDFIDFLGF